MVIEIAASSVSYDLHDKLRAYRRNGVQEYLVLAAFDKDVHWFNWRGGEDHLLTPGDDGILRSRIFPGLWLDPVRFWQGDVAGVLTILQQGLATPEHAQFVHPTLHPPPLRSEPPSFLSAHANTARTTTPRTIKAISL